MPTRADLAHRARFERRRRSNRAEQHRAHRELGAAMARRLGMPEVRDPEPEPELTRSVVYTDTFWDTSSTTSTITSTNWTITAGDLIVATGNFAREMGVTKDVWTKWATTTTTSANYYATNDTGIWYQVADEKVRRYRAKAPAMWVNWHNNPNLIWDARSGEHITPDEYNARQLQRQAEAEEQHRLARIAYEEREALRELADARAVDLLGMVLGPEQLAAYQADQAVTVVTPKGRIIQVAKGWAGNAAEICPRTGRRLRRFCIHPRDHAIPDTDNVLAQILMLQTDEDEFFATAYAGA